MSERGPNPGISEFAAALRGGRRIDLSEQVRELGAELEDRPSEMVVVTGYAELTSLGDTEATRRRELLGETAARQFPTGNKRTQIAAHAEFNPLDHFSRQDMLGMSKLSAMMRVVARDAARRSGILDQDGRLDPRFHRDHVGTTISTSVGHMGNIIATNETIERESRGEKTHITSKEILKVLPEQSNAGVAQNLGISGWGSNSQEACATSLSSIADANLLIRSGKNRVVLAGGFEDTLSDGMSRPAVGLFSALRGAISTNNEYPENAIRPYDKDRDGFVMASGGGVMVLESLESALERGATIYATILNAEKAMDGSDNPTLLDADRVARLLLKTLKVQGEEKGFYLPDAIFTHATATRAGDLAEIEAFRKALTKYLPNIPTTAIKSIHGHLLGGAGVINAIAAVRSLHEGIIQPTINLVNRSEEFMDLDIVTQARETQIQTAIATAFGFGGYDAAVLFGKYR